MIWLADLVYLLAGIAYLPLALYNASVRGKNRSGWAERFVLRSLPPSTNPRIWIHAVSLGEVNATRRLVEQLEQTLPVQEVVVSTTTDTGYARALELYGPSRVFRFPLDFHWVVRRALDRIRPCLIVLIELEVWYNLIQEAHRRRIPVVVVNGRLSERSTRRFRYLGGVVRSMFGRLDWVAAQDECIARRFESLGVPKARLTVLSSLKWDTADAGEKRICREDTLSSFGLDDRRPKWVCASTGNGEEELILDAYERVRTRIAESRGGAEDGLKESLMLTERHDPNYGQAIVARDLQACTASAPSALKSPQLVIAPRKPERFDGVARLIGKRGFRCVRRSRGPDSAGSGADSGDPVWLVDTLGELRLFFDIADVVFVGRSLVPMGGSDPIEPAARGRVILIGPHWENFEVPVRALQEVGVCRVVDDAEELARAVVSTLANPAESARLGLLARATVRSHQGATRLTVDRLRTLIPVQVVEPNETYGPVDAAVVN